MEIFQVPTKIYMGRDAIGQIKTLPMKRACVICDPFLKSSGMVKRVTDLLDEQGISYDVYSDVVPDPPIESIVAGIEQCLGAAPDAIITFGGGSAIDTGKAISYFYTKAARLDHRPFCVAIPTTSGTGSEVTDFSVLTDPEAESKFSLVDPILLPNVAILEPDFVKSVPPAVTADTGMDVLTHAIEAFVSTKACDFSDAMAEKAVKLVFEYLPVVYREPENLDARERIHNASCMAGIAFNHAALGLNHSMAHALGGTFHIPHGRANAVLLPYVIRFNAGFDHGFAPSESRAAQRYAMLARLLGLSAFNASQGAKNLANAVVELKRSVGEAHCIKELGIERSELERNLDHMTEAALRDNCSKTNPRELSAETVRRLFELSYDGRF